MSALSLPNDDPAAPSPFSSTTLAHSSNRTTYSLLFHSPQQPSSTPLGTLPYHIPTDPVSLRTQRTIDSDQKKFPRQKMQPPPAHHAASHLPYPIYGGGACIVCVESSTLSGEAPSAMPHIWPTLDLRVGRGAVPAPRHSLSLVVITQPPWILKPEPLHLLRQRCYRPSLYYYSSTPALP